MPAVVPKVAGTLRRAVSPLSSKVAGTLRRAVSCWVLRHRDCAYYFLSQPCPKVAGTLRRAVSPPSPKVAGTLRRAVSTIVAAHGVCLLLFAAIVGCGGDDQLARQIQSKQHARVHSETRQDHLGEAFRLLSQWVDLNREKASQQIRYHLNQWLDEKPTPDAIGVPAAAVSLRSLIDDDQLAGLIDAEEFAISDVNHLRDAYLFQRIVRWVDVPGNADPLLEDWLTAIGEERGEQVANELRTASRLFDWTVRNITLEPRTLGGPPPPPDMTLPPGMKFQGAGYRQSDYETVWRGLGDALQRAGVFEQLCRQAGLMSAVLTTPTTADGQNTAWAVGVLVDQQIYLFEPELGLPIPGPDQQGIATLQQARRDASVMRRLNVPGFFDYPLGRDDAQQSIAMLNLMPEAMSSRMKILQDSLTGDRRMTLFVDVDDASQRWDECEGISGVRVWPVPIQAEMYRSILQQQAALDPLFAFWYQSRWAIMDADVDMPRKLSRGRWRHLVGQFADDEQTVRDGARTLYLQQRAPEFEIEDLRINPELQKAYGIRRELGMDPETYDRQVQQIQDLMRLGKRTATYWLSLVQYDDGRVDTAQNWLAKRVLDDDQPSPWKTGATYNLARTHEDQGQVEAAIELYKTDDHPQEHGNRIRARLLQRDDS